MGCSIFLGVGWDIPGKRAMHLDQRMIFWVDLGIEMLGILVYGVWKPNFDSMIVGFREMNLPLFFLDPRPS